MHSGDEHYEWDANVPSRESFEQRLDRAYADLDKAMEAHKELTLPELELLDAWRNLVSESCVAEGLFDESHPDPGVCADLHRLAKAYRAPNGASLARPPNPINKASPQLTAVLCKSGMSVSSLLNAITTSWHKKFSRSDDVARAKFSEWVKGIETFVGLKTRDRHRTHDRWAGASIEDREGVVEFLWVTLRMLESGACGPGHLPDWKQNRSFKSIGETHDLSKATQSLTIGSSGTRSHSPPRDSDRGSHGMRSTYRDRRDTHSGRDARGRSRSPGQRDTDMSYSLAHALLGRPLSTRKARIYGML
ncbi:hypothetical protein NBRC10513v2_007844 [Rhodotorula toruloides]|uniref:Antifreeze glyco protein n=1 Tax=Rhodotorula toruloides TaxID=5286 RepID=A0A2T0AC57_RHOTO|nr:antifreeze glyco protein [Rhodotorula toruloides]